MFSYSICERNVLIFNIYPERSHIQYMSGLYVRIILILNIYPDYSHILYNIRIILVLNIYPDYETYSIYVQIILIYNICQNYSHIQEMTECTHIQYMNGMFSFMR